jgi:hypothetical protein
MTTLIALVLAVTSKSSGETHFSRKPVDVLTPTFECSDKTLEQVYDYRWSLYKAHIRDIGAKGFVITEFLDDVGWQKSPYAMLNDATAFHICEGRWMRDRHYIDGFIDFLYDGGGNDRHFSESITDAAYQYAVAKGDLRFAAQYLPAMKHIYNLWDDHFDFGKGLYFIEPLLDATEYTVSSIDASGGKDGFTGGQAFRPSINSYMFGNARAISKLSASVGDKVAADDYESRAQALKARMQAALWSDKFGHFIDRYQVTNRFVKYWEPIRARELVGFVPWAYGIPDDTAEHGADWKHALAPDKFAGTFGLRTHEPTYEYYMRQYRYEGTRPECQWNGPSWPFQTTQVLLGMANALNNYQHADLTSDDYVKTLRQYAAQHTVGGKLDLQEDYNPDKGDPIVGLDRSHHYNHSGFNDLVITGLCGVRPRADDTLEVHPLLPKDGSIGYFLLENLPYHGHNITVMWDRDGKQYGKGIGLSVYVDGKRAGGDQSPTRLTFQIPKPVVNRPAVELNKTVNIYRSGFPSPSVTSDPLHTMWQAIDGRTWFFPEIPHGWTTSADRTVDSLTLDLGQPQSITKVGLSFFGGEGIVIPSRVGLEAWIDGAWTSMSKPSIKANARIWTTFSAVTASKLRLSIEHIGSTRLVQFEAF